MNLSPLYLRDLKDLDREMMEDLIRKDRPDLIPALENGDDIIIGGYFKASDFKIV